MSLPIGNDMKFYVNTGTYDTPVWALVGIWKDLTQGDTADEVEVSDRESPFKKYEPGMVDMPIEGSLSWKTANANFTLIRNAYIAQTSLDILILDKLVAEATAVGVRMPVKVFSFGSEQALADAVSVPVTMKVAYVTELVESVLTVREPVYYPLPVEP